jgi:hypothetical protein
MSRLDAIVHGHHVLAETLFCATGSALQPPTYAAGTPAARIEVDHPSSKEACHV